MTYKSPNGYTGVIYGKSSLAIFNEQGHEVMHTGFRAIHTMEELKDNVDRFPEFMRILEGEQE